MELWGCLCLWHVSPGFLIKHPVKFKLCDWIDWNVSCRITLQWKRSTPATCRILQEGWNSTKSTGLLNLNETCPDLQPRGSARRSAPLLRGFATRSWCTAGTTVSEHSKYFQRYYRNDAFYTFVLLTPDVIFCFWTVFFLLVLVIYVSWPNLFQQHVFR